MLLQQLSIVITYFYMRGHIMLSDNDKQILAKLKTDYPEAYDFYERHEAEHKALLKRGCHDLRNIVTLLSGSYQLLGLTNPQLNLLPRFMTMGNDIKSLIQAFNDIALFRYASTISPEPVTLSELEKAVRVFISDNLFQAADHINLISVSPCTTVNLDSSRLVSAIGCIIRNAVEASDFDSEPSSPVRVTLTVTDSHTLCAEISNSGCRPSPDIADTMFDPFCTNRQEHLGLGLAIAAETADAMGGTISWEHDNGITTFRLNVRI